VQQCPKWFV